MNRARVYCVPSIIASSGDAEGLPITLLEAHAMKLPSALFAIPPVSEAVEDGKTSLLAAERDVEVLARNILTLLENQELWHHLSEAGREHVCRKFDLHSQTEKLEGIYDTVISDRTIGEEKTGNSCV